MAGGNGQAGARGGAAAIHSVPEPAGVGACARVRAFFFHIYSYFVHGYLRSTYEVWSTSVWVEGWPRLAPATGLPIPHSRSVRSSNYPAWLRLELAYDSMRSSGMPPQTVGCSEESSTLFGTGYLPDVASPLAYPQSRISTTGRANIWNAVSTLLKG